MECDRRFEPDDEDLSVLEYARWYGICTDYTSEQFDISSVAAPFDDAIDRDLQDPSDDLITNAVCVLTRERLAVNKEAALLLKATFLLQGPPVNEILKIDRREWMLSLKQELPVLSSSHELDLLHFGTGTMPDFRNLRIPYEITNEESDEGLQWPTKYLAYPAQCDALAQVERMAVTKDALIFLQNAIRDEYTPEDSDKIKEAALAYEPTVRPVTPPLLPLSPPPSPYILSSPANRLPFLSDSDDSVLAEANALRDQIMAADALKRNSSDSSDLMLLDVTHPSPRSSPLSGTYVSPVTKRRAEDLKVEGPLTTPMFSTSPMKKLKSVSFADILNEYIPRDAEFDELNINFDEFDDLMQEIKPLAAEAKRKAENEQLSNADTTARVDIPDIDFTLPLAPWNEYSLSQSGRRKANETQLDAQSMFLLRIKREDLKMAKSWHGISALERELPWGIFTTKVASISLNERLHGETEVDRLLAESAAGNIATSSSLVWKRKGLRLLDEEEDEEEIDPEAGEEQKNVEALVRKRKLELEEEAMEIYHKKTAPRPDLLVSDQLSQKRQASHHWQEPSIRRHEPLQPRSKTISQCQWQPQAAPSRQESRLLLTESGNDLMFGGFSASTALHKFMETRGRPSTEIVQKHLPTQFVASVTQALPVRSREPSAASSHSSGPQVSAQLGSIDQAKQQPHLSSVPIDLLPSSFIVSSALLQKRSLMKQIENLYSSAEIIYRDYTLPHSAANEADILLSPSTGLIFTTLQQVKQRALPGQPDRSPVKERMRKLQARYERLVVMVGEGLTREMEELGSSRPVDSRDTEMQLQFEAFTAQLEGEVLVKFVRGGEQALARSIVIEMERYGLPHGSVDIGDIKPLAAETNVSTHSMGFYESITELIVAQWEIFLRRSGLNPFAAQVIVASLKVPFDVQIPATSSSSRSTGDAKTVAVSGLPALLMMHEEERVRGFQALMGGSRILRRISKVLDQEWVSAVHGSRL